MSKFNVSFLVAMLLAVSTAWAQEEWGRKFEQLGSELPSPNSYRNGAGAPGKNYWQQQADYVIDVTIDDKTQVLRGSEMITYHNNSPHTLSYLWVQLDQNVRAPGNLASQTRTGTIRDSTAAKFFAGSVGATGYNGGYAISKVVDAEGNPLEHTINRTMMRIDLPAPLKPGEQTTFGIDWSYNIYDRMLISGRGGYEYFPEDGNYAYTLAQWFPRMAVYDDYEGGQTPHVQ